MFGNLQYSNRKLRLSTSRVFGSTDTVYSLRDGYSFGSIFFSNQLVGFPSNLYCERNGARLAEVTPLLRTSSSY